MKRFKVENDYFAFTEECEIILFTTKTTKRKVECVLRNNLPIKRIVKHLYASHRNSDVERFKEMAFSLKQKEPIANNPFVDGWTRSKGLFYQYNFYKNRVVIGYNE
ncbi:MAG: hypothetical protein II063_10435 [Prevotella sp.]|nr:hypothetical protein [Prevotella sp.]